MRHDPRMPEAGRETGDIGRFLSQAQVDVRLAGLAATQHGVLALAHLRALGLSESAVHKRVAAGRLHRRFHGVYSVVPTNLLSRNGHYLAAVLACGPGAVLSHRSAAMLLGLRQTAATKIDITVPSRSGIRHAGVSVHRSRNLTAADATVVENIPCTSVARTLLDLAEVVPRRPLERAFDQSEILRLLDLKAIDD